LIDVCCLIYVLLLFALNLNLIFFQLRAKVQNSSTCKDTTAADVVEGDDGDDDDAPASQEVDDLETAEAGDDEVFPIIQGPKRRATKPPTTTPSTTVVTTVLQSASTTTTTIDPVVLQSLAARAVRSDELKRKLDSVLAEHTNPDKAEKLNWGQWLSTCATMVPNDTWSHFLNDSFALMSRYVVRDPPPHQQVPRTAAFTQAAPSQSQHISQAPVTFTSASVTIAQPSVRSYGDAAASVSAFRTIPTYGSYPNLQSGRSHTPEGEFLDISSSIVCSAETLNLTTSMYSPVSFMSQSMNILDSDRGRGGSFS